MFKRTSIVIAASGLLLMLTGERSWAAPAVQVGLNADADGYVKTPGGLYHRSCVSVVPSGSSIDQQGRVTLDGKEIGTVPTTCAYAPREIHRPRPAAERLTAQQKRAMPGAFVTPGGDASPAIGFNGWINSIAATDPFGPGRNSFTQLFNKWKVPPAPDLATDQVLFIFSAFMSSTEIIQPVLQWGSGSAAGGGNYWAVASWWVYNNNQNWVVSSLLPVDSGDVIQGQLMKFFCGRNPDGSADFHCSWNVTVVDMSMAVRGIADNSRGLNIVTQNEMFDVRMGALEVYNVTACSQLPGYIGFYETMVKGLTPSGSVQSILPYLQWGPSTVSAPACPLKVASLTSASGNLLAGLQLAPALSARALAVLAILLGVVGGVLVSRRPALVLLLLAGLTVPQGCGVSGEPDEVQPPGAVVATELDGGSDPGSLVAPAPDGDASPPLAPGPDAPVDPLADASPAQPPDIARRLEADAAAPALRDVDAGAHFGACTHPQQVNGDCAYRAEGVQVCQVPNGATVDKDGGVSVGGQPAGSMCVTPCDPAEGRYVVMCSTAGHNPEGPPPELGCNAIPLPWPLGTLGWCCPCL